MEFMATGMSVVSLSYVVSLNASAVKLYISPESYVSATISLATIRFQRIGLRLGNLSAAVPIQYYCTLKVNSSVKVFKSLMFFLY
jgi:hypothetical protein